MVLSEREARGLWLWVTAANDWSETSQGLVSNASELSTVSRDLADVLEEDGTATSPHGAPVGFDRPALAGELRQLATAVEDQSAELRNRYLATAADIEAFRSILG
jgi:hypothetical protein